MNSFKFFCVLALLHVWVVFSYESKAPVWDLVHGVEISIFAPAPRYHHGFAITGGDFGLFTSGYDFDDGGVFLNDTWVFQISTNKWRPIDPVTVLTRAYFTAHTNGDEIIIYGGNGPSGVVFGDIWRFNATTSKWTRDIFNSLDPFINLILQRQFHASTIYNGTLYVFGGHTRVYGYTTNDLLAYNLTSGVWRLLQQDGAVVDSPSGRQGHTLHAFNDSVHGPSLVLFGGYCDRPWTGGYNDTWQYIIQTNKWIKLSNTTAPSARYGHSGVVFNNTLVIYGGMSTQNINNPPPYDVYYGDVWSLQLYGGGNSSWVNVLPDTEKGPGRRQGHQTALVNSTLYCAGGYIQFVGLGNDIWSLELQ